MFAQYIQIGHIRSSNDDAPIPPRTHPHPAPIVRIRPPRAAPLDVTSQEICPTAWARMALSTHLVRLDLLEAVQPELLLRFLRPFAEYLATKGVSFDDIAVDAA